MKRTILLLGIIFSFVAVRAQSTPDPLQQRAHTYAVRLQKALNLSDDQTIQVQQVFVDHIQDVQRINTENTQPAEHQQKAQEAMENMDHKLASIFTPTQYADYLKLKREKEAQRASSPMGRD